MTNLEAIQLLQSFSNAVAQLAEDVSPSVVNVNAGRRSGTGVVWSREGHILTASHVLGHGTPPRVTLSDGREMDAQVLGRDRYTDVAVLKVEADGLSPIQMGSSKDAKVGQFVLAFANAFGKKPSATSGIVTSPGRSVRGWWGTEIEDAIVSDAKLNPGYSGGPLVDATGRMIGMNVAYFAGRGVAVSADSVRGIVEMLLKDGKVKKGFLGVVVEQVELPAGLAESSEVGQETGLMVRAVEEGSPARAAGVAMGDIILRLGEARATDEHELHKALRGDSAGSAQSLWVLRGEKPIEMKVTPGEVES